MNDDDIARFLKSASRGQLASLLEALQDTLGSYRRPVVRIIDHGPFRTSNPPHELGNPPYQQSVRLLEVGPDRLGLGLGGSHFNFTSLSRSGQRS
jgi:hypothetical protein